MINRIIKKIPLASPEPTNEYLNVCQSGYEKCDGGYTYGPAVREFYLIHYVISGKGTLKTEDSFYQLSARQAFIIYPEEVTTYSADECEPWYYCFFAFSGSLAAELVERTEFRGGNRVVTLPDNNIFEIIDETTMALKWARDNQDLYALSQLFRLIDILQQVRLIPLPLLSALQKTMSNKRWITSISITRLTFRYPSLQINWH